MSSDLFHILHSLQETHLYLPLIWSSWHMGGCLPAMVKGEAYHLSEVGGDREERVLVCSGNLGDGYLRVFM